MHEEIATSSRAQSMIFRPLACHVRLAMGRCHWTRPLLQPVNVHEQWSFDHSLHTRQRRQTCRARVAWMLGLWVSLLATSGSAGHMATDGGSCHDLSLAYQPLYSLAVYIYQSAWDKPTCLARCAYTSSIVQAVFTMFSRCYSSNQDMLLLLPQSGREWHVASYIWRTWSYIVQTFHLWQTLGHPCFFPSISLGVSSQPISRFRCSLRYGFRAGSGRVPWGFPGSSGMWGYHLGLLVIF